MPQRSTQPFRYCGFDLGAATRTLRCRYEVGQYSFEEIITVEAGNFDEPGVEAAARQVFLLAGISYYKAFASTTIDLGDTEITSAQAAMLRAFYVEGLGEYAYRNNLDLRDLHIDARITDGAPASSASSVSLPLVPFGGGMDSLVSVELIRRCTPDLALFVLSRPHDRFAAIETAIEATGLPVIRASRQLDPTILRSKELGFFNGHVPVTGIVSAVAMLTARMNGFDAVAMSNEWSASSGNVEHNGHIVNHQYSKSLEFETLLGASYRSTLGSTPHYFSLLRPFSELWIAREFATHPAALRAFRSCNKAFYLDPSKRLDRWCGECDKCAFIDLILSPFVPAEDLAEVFDQHEPLDNSDLFEVFRSLIGTSPDFKPFECVGDVNECRQAVLLASQRQDRAGTTTLQVLASELADTTSGLDSAALLQPIGPHHIPDPYASDLRLG